MDANDLAFDDFVDDCLLNEDTICKSAKNNLDLVVEELMNSQESDDLIAA